MKWTEAGVRWLLMIPRRNQVHEDPTGVIDRGDSVKPPLDLQMAGFFRPPVSRPGPVV